MLQGASRDLGIHTMKAKLVSLNQAAPRIAEAFRCESHCLLQVQEQRAFKDDRWLCLGTISLPLKSPNMPNDEGEQQDAKLAIAAFEWRLPDAEKVESELASLLGMKPRDDDYSKIARTLDQIASVAVRSGLLHPAFDPAAIEEMPFRRATTVVSDTSGVLQGALDFIVRHLHPAARVKIPAIVQMEFVNFGDRFFRIRRSNEAKARKGNNSSKLLRANELIEHLKSQGGQRALLRLELQSDTEIERTYLLGDPLRDAFRSDRDRALRDLNINVSVPAYADRLILEAARHHQAQSEPGHAVRLLTSDQGLARMALAEGMTPLYFTAVKYTDVFGTRLTGQTFHPFTGSMHSIPLTLALWELATAFGAVRLQWENGVYITISALSDSMSWSPFHSLDDLLWFDAEGAASSDASTSEASAPAADLRTETARKEPSNIAGNANRNVSFQRMSVNRLLRLICALDDSQVLEAVQVAELLNVRNARSAGGYRRFLLSANLVEIENGRWIATPSIQLLSAELRNENAAALYEALLRAPSFYTFNAHVTQSEIGRPIDLPGPSRSTTTYRTLGELTLICASIGREVYTTPTRLSSRPFAQIALRRFVELDSGDGLVATGRWLESLIRHDGIHPEVARLSLEQANEEGLLRRSTEGSTMQTAFDNHVVHILRVDTDTSRMPAAKPVHLYRGDYLIPGKASVSLRIEEAKP